MRSSALVWLLACVFPLAASAQQSGRAGARRRPHSLLRSNKAPLRRRRRSDPRRGCSCRWCRPVRSSARRSAAWARTFTSSTPTAGSRCSASPTSTPRRTPPLPRRLPARRLAPTTIASSASRPSGYIKNDYDDYLGTGQPLKTNDDLQGLAGRYLYRVKGQLVHRRARAAPRTTRCSANPRRTTSCSRRWASRGFKSAALGAVVMHDSRDNEDMPTRGWYLNLNNLAYREALGGDVILRRLPRGPARLLAARRRPRAGVPAVQLADDRRALGRAGDRAAARLQARRVPGAVHVVVRSRRAPVLQRPMGRHALRRRRGPVRRERHASRPAATSIRPCGAGIHFVIKPVQRMLVNFEYAQGVEGNHGVFLKFGYGW